MASLDAVIQTHGSSDPTSEVVTCSSFGTLGDQLQNQVADLLRKHASTSHAWAWRGGGGTRAVQLPPEMGGDTATAGQAALALQKSHPPPAP